MNASDHLDQRAASLTSAAREFRSAAGRPGSQAAAPDSLASLEHALRALSDAWYQLADSSRSGRWQKVDGVSREQDVRLMGALHDIAAAFARCARACREGRSTVAPLIDRRLAAGPGDYPEHDNEVLDAKGTPQRVA